MTTKKIIILSVIVIAVGIASWFTYDFLFLRVISTTPQKNAVATTTPYIRFEFNRDIASIGKTTISGQATASHIEGKSIKIDIPENTLVAGDPYSISLHDISSKDGKKITSYNFDFVAKYIDINKQPEEIQKALVSKSNSGQVDSDPFLLLPFPMGTTEDLPFYLSATIDASYTRPLIEVTFIDEIKPYGSATKPQVSNARADELYAQVIQYIKDKGGTPKNYDLYFSNDYLNLKTGVIGD